MRYNAGDPTLERRSVDLALELRPERTADARRFLKDLTGRATESLEKGQDVAEVAKAAVELAELKEIEGNCLLLESEFQAAASAFNEAISYDPSRVLCYVQLARLDRNELKAGPKVADSEIDWMLANNPKSGLAHLHRFRYVSQFHPPAPDSELKQALELEPENAEILLTAAAVAEQKKDLVAARTFLQKGLELHPQNAAFPMVLAGLETRDGHFDRAEAVLRQADQANPSSDLAFELAVTLIAQNKIDGKDQADGYMARLREAGFGETLVRYLEAQVLYQRKQWSEAIPKIETARNLLRSIPRLETPLNLMLVECYSRVGADEQRLESLRQAAGGDRSPEATRIEFGQSLARAGKLDEAIAVFLPLAERKPEVRPDLVSILIQKASRTPRDPRAWQEVERQLKQAEKTLPQATERLTLLRADMLAARDRQEEARSVLAAAQAKDPKNLPYRLALARLTQRMGKGSEALKTLDEAEKELGPDLAITLARLDCLGQQGEPAKAAVARLAETRQQVPAADRPALLDRLAVTELRLHEPALARQHWGELASLQPENIRVRLSLFDLAIEAGEQDGAADLVKELQKIEGGNGTYWRFAQAALLLDKVRRGASKDLEEARVLADQISRQRPDWWAGPTLHGELAELAGSPDQADQAVEHYLRAVDLGNAQPPLARRLVGLLNERNRLSDIDHVAQVLRERGVALDEITLVKAVEAIRKQDFDQGIALARQIFNEKSTNPADHLTLGRFYSSAGQSDAAGKEFERAVELGPGVPDAWLTYVQYLAQAKQIEQAKKTIEAARQALPADRAALTLAQCWMAVGDFKRAEDLLGKALSGEGKSADPNALKTAALVALSQNQLFKVDEYLTRLDHAANLSASDKAWANRIRVALLLKKGRMADQDQALALIDQNLRDNPNSIEDQRNKATVLALRPSRRGEAVKILEQLGAANLLDAKEQFLLAQLYLGQGEEQKYQDEMLKLLKLKTRSPQHLAHFVNYWIGHNQLDQADRWLGELKRPSPRAWRPWSLRPRCSISESASPSCSGLLQAREQQSPDQIGLVADLLNRYGFAKEAEAGYKASVAQDPMQPERILALAHFLASQGKTSEALKFLSQVCSTCPAEGFAASALSLWDATLLDEKQRHQIEALLVDACKKRPDELVLSTAVASLRTKQGRFDEAEAMYRHMLASNPMEAATLNNLSWLIALRDPKNCREALELVNRAIDIRGHHPSLIDTRAVIYIRNGEFQSAIDDLTKVRNVDPQNATFGLHLAWAYQSQGHKAEALREFKKALELGWKPGRCDPLERSIVTQLSKDLGINLEGKDGHYP